MTVLGPTQKRKDRGLQLPPLKATTEHDLLPRGVKSNVGRPRLGFGARAICHTTKQDDCRSTAYTCTQDLEGW